MSARKLRLYHRLQLAAHRLQKAADRQMIAAGRITTAQSAVIAIIARSSSASQSSIARELGINESAVTTMTGRLIGMGLIERSRSETDARSWQLSLTAEGRDVTAAVERSFAGINRKLEQVLSPKELEQLADCLGRIADAFAQSD